MTSLHSHAADPAARFTLHKNRALPYPADAIPRRHIAAVLVGFPAVSTLVSLLLLDRQSLAWTGLDFFTTFWWLIAVWYVAQIVILGRVLHASGWTWCDIGFTTQRRGTMWLVGGYLLLAFGLVAFIEFALRRAGLDAAALGRLSDLANLTPKSLPQRIAFVFMGLAGGLCEELVYRGFAIQALKRQRAPGWLAVLIAALPFVVQHGLKAIPQFEWFFAWALVFGATFLWRKSLWLNLVLHWLVILSALPAVLEALR